MGVQISSIIQKKEINLEDLSGKKIAIDAYNALFQFLSIIRDKDTGDPLKDSKGRITSHLSGLFYRTVNFLEIGIKPVYVFDGEAPVFKKITQEKREEQRRIAEEKMKIALELGKIEDVLKYAQATARLSKEIVEDSKKLIKLMGIPYVEAPSEGEMQAAYLAKKGDVWACASQDYDSLLAGSPRLIRNLNLTGKRKLPGREVYVEIKPELIELEEVLKSLGLTREQLIIVGILVGTDYNPDGIEGIGPKKALKLVKEKKTLENVMKEIEWKFEVGAEEIYNFFLNPPVTDNYTLEWKQPNEEELIKFMVEEHNFSEERIRNGIEKIKQSIQKHQQKDLSKWFKS
ncbi:MAG: flap endonuclease-1 [Candidatus Aenigmarchaeota archaeon]|nr:flap endonuclease-1 [Candidatus Aenigmarchaeota archaeon]MDW8159826.1 flap endonuclease-1 [Candidatus Aenigmarchaeota archaeon]